MYPLLTIGEVSRRSGVALSTLRYYEERGLISSVRAESGHRRYGRAVLRRIAFIVFAQTVGLTLEEIGEELAKLPADRFAADEDWARLSAGWIGRIDARIEQLRRVRHDLTECIGCGCLSMERCKLVNAQDRAAAGGAGPRFGVGDPRPPAPGAEEPPQG